MVKEDELEFISVSGEDESDNMISSSYVDPSVTRDGSSTIGNWFFNQSKVHLCKTWSNDSN
jgi:hypothetical protein